MKTIYIKSADDVAALARDVRTGKRRNASEIKVSLDGVKESDAEILSQEINKHYFSYGCQVATILGLSALAASIGWVASNTEHWQNVDWRDGLIILSSIIIATGIGKAFGRWRDKSALQYSVDKLISLEPRAQELGK